MSHDKKKNAPVSEELSALDVYRELSKAAIEQIDRHIAMLKKMQSREAEGSASLALKKAEPIQLTVNNTVFSVLGKTEDYIDTKNSNDPKKRIKSFGGKGTVVPGDKPIKEIPAKGSGGDIQKNAMAAGPKPPAAKPAGVPAAPPPPKAPGAAPTMHKMDIPTSTEKANGGPQPTKKMEIPASHEKANGGPQPTKKMDMPDSVEQANGGQEMAKMALSPVFAVKSRIGGKDPTSQQMTHDASKAAHAAAMGANTAQALPQNKLPTMAQHAQRAATMNAAMPNKAIGHTMGVTPSARHAPIDLPADDGGGQVVQGADAMQAFMPVSHFGKKEMDDMKCPRCKKGMTLCKCDYKSSKMEKSWPSQHNSTYHTLPEEQKQKLADAHGFTFSDYKGLYAGGQSDYINYRDRNMHSHMNNDGKCRICGSEQK